MATSTAGTQGLLRCIVPRGVPGVAVMKFPFCQVSNTPGPVSSFQHGRCVHLSPVLSAKSLMHKFSTKSKKKLWYENPSYTRPESQPPGLMSLMKQEQKERRGNNVRIRALNMILYKALTGLLSTAEVSEEIFDHCIELSKVSVTFDVSTCRAYWKTSGNKDTDAEIDTLLQQYAPRFRHLMITHQVLGRVPPIVFIKDKEDVKRQEIEELLATLDFGDNHDTTMKSSEEARKPDFESSSEVSALHSASMFGVNHLELNKQIADYKKKMKERHIETDDIELSKQQQEQLTAIRKQKLLRKKMKMQKANVQDYISPQDYLLSADSHLYSEQEEEFESELQEDSDLFEEQEYGGEELK